METKEHPQRQDTKEHPQQKALTLSLWLGDVKEKRKA